jgi:hypothetical protein
MSYVNFPQNKLAGGAGYISSGWAVWALGRSELQLSNKVFYTSLESSRF